MFELVGFEVLHKSYTSENGFSFFVFIRSKKLTGRRPRSYKLIYKSAFLLRESWIHICTDVTGHSQRYVRA
jgi:hypothetical protein